MVLIIPSGVGLRVPGIGNVGRLLRWVKSIPYIPRVKISLFLQNIKKIVGHNRNSPLSLVWMVWHELCSYFVLTVFFLLPLFLLESWPRYVVCRFNPVLQQCSNQCIQQRSNPVHPAAPAISVSLCHTVAHYVSCVVLCVCLFVFVWILVYVFSSSDLPLTAFDEIACYRARAVFIFVSDTACKRACMWLEFAVVVKWCPTLMARLKLSLRQAPVLHEKDMDKVSSSPISIVSSDPLLIGTATMEEYWNENEAPALTIQWAIWHIVHACEQTVCIHSVRVHHVCHIAHWMVSAGASFHFNIFHCRCPNQQRIAWNDGIGDGRNFGPCLSHEEPGLA